MDFFKPRSKKAKNGDIIVYPEFIVQRSSDLMIRGGKFYAIWNEQKKRWSTDEYDAQLIIDSELYETKREIEVRNQYNQDLVVVVESVSNFSNGHWVKFKNFIKNLQDNHTTLDDTLTFLNTETEKKDFVSKRLSYPLLEGPTSAYEELMSTLYDPDERKKIEWAIGAIISGDSKTIQKFLVLYGAPGGGKSTVLNIIQKLFEGYYTTFDAKALTSNSNSFSTEVFRENPLVSIQHDGDLSRIEDNTLLNQIVSHEIMVMNEKYKSSYTSSSKSMLFIGTNKPVKISDAKSGVIRRLIDVRTSGRKVPTKRYHVLVNQIDFELGAIASYCLNIYKSMGKNYYSGYRPIDMILQTDVFFNFVESNFFVFKKQNGISLAQAYELFKVFCEESGLDYKLPRHKFREELKNYFEYFDAVKRVDEKQVRSYYSGFLFDKFNQENSFEKEESISWLSFDQTKSLLDDQLSDRKAQYASEIDRVPTRKWVNTTTTLSDLNTSLIHYVQPPSNRIVIDFDLKDESGNKSLELNIIEASKWPETYAELSQSGNAIHLHYDYEGDVTRLSRIYSYGIEIKVFTGDSALRRKLTKCNNIQVATINSGLPLKGEKRVYDNNLVTTEKTIIELIFRNLGKEIHPNTRPSIDFIKKILDDAYESGVRYDVTPLRAKILDFAMNSTNQSEYCVNIVGRMKFKSEHEEYQDRDKVIFSEDEKMVFYDVEVFPNLLLIRWKYEGEEEPLMGMINPDPIQIEELLNKKLVGFNCRRYDNHILYAAKLGMSNLEIFKVSQNIVEGDSGALFREAYKLSYTDVYDFSSAQNKKSLKRWQIELGIDHKELGLDWTKDAPKELWHIISDYCDNDVVSTEKVFKHLSADWTARLILSELSGLTPNDSTNSHATKIMFGDDKNPQSKFIYTDLSTIFPGYTFDNGKSLYRGEDPGEGGYVYAEPGIYENVVLLDVASMHPTSVEMLELFGKKYTDRYRALKEARLAIKHNELNKLSTMLDGKLKKIIDSKSDSKFKLSDLSNALKTVLVSVYGLTSATYDNAFRDPRNKDNIVAKRGALFMIDLKEALQKRGDKVIHIKTDSVKVANASQETIDFVMSFGKKYGYIFEHEHTYSKICLVNNAVYIAKDSVTNEWSATGAEFAHPYIFKNLFSKEEVNFQDLIEIKNVTGTSVIYLDLNEKLEDVSELEKEWDLRIKENEGKTKERKKRPYKDLPLEELSDRISKGHNFIFVGKISSFVPVKKGFNGGILYRNKDGKNFSITGTKGYRWLETHIVKDLYDWKKAIDFDYYSNLLDEAIAHISSFGDFNSFVK